MFVNNFKIHLIRKKHSFCQNHITRTKHILQITYIINMNSFSSLFKSNNKHKTAKFMNITYTTYSVSFNMTLSYHYIWQNYLCVLFQQVTEHYFLNTYMISRYILCRNYDKIPKKYHTTQAAIYNSPIQPTITFHNNKIT